MHALVVEHRECGEVEEQVFAHDGIWMLKEVLDLTHQQVEVVVLQGDAVAELSGWGVLLMIIDYIR